MGDWDILELRDTGEGTLQKRKSYTYSRTKYNINTFRYLFREDVPHVVNLLEDNGIGKSISCSYYHTGAVME